eukprot:CAMPEP_0180635446 /NCGR_PEP_ID=MMETSP1037_2-20121125/42649_1 /TAXON_ID=632150 /ORGANISM="Azadinium spinosum, Strain 3D9" /LENGTH=137 /DNA_ID=CAMNT_0022656615 /DNA_START=26 /DNA_END=439 /DNA_ORIENTATION=-
MSSSCLSPDFTPPGGGFFTTTFRCSSLNHRVHNEIDELQRSGNENEFEAVPRSRGHGIAVQGRWQVPPATLPLILIREIVDEIKLNDVVNKLQDFAQFKSVLALPRFKSPRMLGKDVTIAITVNDSAEVSSVLQVSQ